MRTTSQRAIAQPNITSPRCKKSPTEKIPADKKLGYCKTEHAEPRTRYARSAIKHNIKPPNKIPKTQCFVVESFFVCVHNKRAGIIYKKFEFIFKFACLATFTAYSGVIVGIVINIDIITIVKQKNAVGYAHIATAVRPRLPALRATKNKTNIVKNGGIDGKAVLCQNVDNLMPDFKNMRMDIIPTITSKGIPINFEVFKQKASKSLISKYSNIFKYKNAIIAKIMVETKIENIF